MLCTLLPANSLPLPVAGIALASIALASIALASIALASTAFRRHTRPQNRHDDATHFSLSTASSYPMYPKTDQEALISSGYPCVKCRAHAYMNYFEAPIFFFAFWLFPHALINSPTSLRIRTVFLLLWKFELFSLWLRLGYPQRPRAGVIMVVAP